MVGGVVGTDTEVETVTVLMLTVLMVRMAATLVVLLECGVSDADTVTPNLAARGSMKSWPSHLDQ